MELFNHGNTWATAPDAVEFKVEFVAAESPASDASQADGVLATLPLDSEVVLPAEQADLDPDTLTRLSRFAALPSYDPTDVQQAKYSLAQAILDVYPHADCVAIVSIPPQGTGQLNVNDIEEHTQVVCRRRRRDHRAGSGAPRPWLRAHGPLHGGRPHRPSDAGPRRGPGDRGDGKDSGPLRREEERARPRPAGSGQLNPWPAESGISVSEIREPTHGHEDAPDREMSC